MGIEVEEKPCWYATCDGCGEGDNLEFGGSYHYESEEETATRLREMDWTEHDGMWLCQSCSVDRPMDDVDCPNCGATAPNGCRFPGEVWPLLHNVHPERLAAYVEKLKAAGDAG